MVRWYKRTVAPSQAAGSHRGPTSRDRSEHRRNQGRALATHERCRRAPRRSAARAHRSRCPRVRVARRRETYVTARLRFRDPANSDCSSCAAPITKVMRFAGVVVVVAACSSPHLGEPTNATVTPDGHRDIDAPRTIDADLSGPTDTPVVPCTNTATEVYAATAQANA